METNATKRTDIFLIDPRNIVVMNDFNVRRDFDLDGKDTVNVIPLAQLLDKTENLSQAMRQYKKEENK